MPASPQEAWDNHIAQADLRMKKISPLEKSAGGGDSGGMDGLAILTARVDGLDKRLDRLDGRMDKLEERLGRVEVQLGRIEGSLTTLTSSVVSRIPTWWQMPAIIGSTVLLLALLYAGAKHFHLVN